MTEENFTRLIISGQTLNTDSINTLCIKCCINHAGATCSAYSNLSDLNAYGVVCEFDWNDGNGRKDGLQWMVAKE